MTSLQSHGNKFHVTVKAMDDMELVPLDTFKTSLEYSLCLHKSMIHFSVSNLGIAFLRAEKRGERKEGMKGGKERGRMPKQQNWHEIGHLHIPQAAAISSASSSQCSEAEMTPKHSYPCLPFLLHCSLQSPEAQWTAHGYPLNTTLCMKLN